MTEQNPSKTNPEPETIEIGKSEAFHIDIPPELWERVERFMKDKFLNKSALTRQALDHFITCDKVGF